MEEVFYNSEYKKAFIKEYGTKTEKQLYSLFSATSKSENEFGKDLSTFTIEEAKETLRSFQVTDVETLRTRVSIIRQYIAFCKKSTPIQGIQNPYDSFDLDLYRALVDEAKVRERFIYEDELNRIIRVCRNPKDQFLLLAPFEGLYGSEYYDLINLEERHLKGNSTFELPSGGELMVSSRLYNLALEAVSEYNYYSMDDKVRRLAQVPNVVKPLLIKNGADVMTPKMIRKRIEKMETVFGRPLGINMIKTSGFLLRFSNLVSENQNLNSVFKTSDYKQLAERYDIKGRPFRIRSLYDDYMRYMPANKK